MDTSALLSQSYMFAHCLQMLQQIPGAHSYDGCLQEDDSNPHDCKPLHACWSALLRRMLKADQTELVLRALDTASASAGSSSKHSVLPLLMPHEAHQLVETARNVTYQGEPLHMWHGCVITMPQVATWPFPHWAQHHDTK